jgi:hypothetical protein
LVNDQQYRPIFHRFEHSKCINDTPVLLFEAGNSGNKMWTASFAPSTVFEKIDTPLHAKVVLSTQWIGDTPQAR